MSSGPPGPAGLSPNSSARPRHAVCSTNSMPRPYSEAVAVTWGELQARAVRRGRLRPVNDIWIAACCLVRALPLATLNVKDYADFAEHEGLALLAR